MESFLFLVMLFVIALFANGLSALAGGGAGLLQLPALLFLGLPFVLALATHKVASVALGVGATLRHWREKTLDRGFLLLMLLSGLPGVIAGALWVVHWESHWAEFLLGGMTLLCGLYSIGSPQLGLKAAPGHRSLTGWIGGGLGLFLIGVLNGSVTSGTGLFVTLWLVLWFGLSYGEAVALTLVIVGLFWNGFGALTLALQTEVQWLWLPPLILGALIGGYAGAHLSLLKGNRLVKRAFEGLTLLVGISLIWRSLPVIWSLQDSVP